MRRGRRSRRKGRREERRGRRERRSGVARKGLKCVEEEGGEASEVYLPIEECAVE